MKGAGNVRTRESRLQAPERPEFGRRREKAGWPGFVKGPPLPQWSIPLFYSAAALLMGLALPRIEHRWFPELWSPVGIDAALEIGSSIATGMLVLTGIVCGVAFVMLRLGGPGHPAHLLPWMARGPLLPHAIGVFSATFLYAMAVLAQLDRLGNRRVSFLSTCAAVALLVASVGVLVGLIRRFGDLQTESVIQLLARLGRNAIDDLYTPVQPPAVPAPEGQLDRTPVTQTLIHTGPPRTIQALDAAALVQAARDSGGVIEFIAEVGDTVAEGITILCVRGAHTSIPEEVLARAITKGEERTFEQDPAYAIRLLVDIAIRALSPAANAPTTAVQVLDQLEDLLLRLGRRPLGIGSFRDRNGVLRLVIPVPTWEDFLSLALDEIRLYGGTSIRVMRRMRALIADLTDTLPADRQPALRREQDRLERAVARAFDDTGASTLAGVEDPQGLGTPRRRRANM